ncbi:hypothetical protein EVC28_071 [Rhizobium phage RHph_I1_23]|nr:hypothetical protein EVC28_071 [Rhizobium phage RHph_I1_23]
MKRMAVAAVAAALTTFADFGLARVAPAAKRERKAQKLRHLVSIGALQAA